MQHILCPVDMGYVMIITLSCMDVVELSGIVPFLTCISECL